MVSGDVQCVMPDVVGHCTVSALTREQDDLREENSEEVNTKKRPVKERKSYPRRE